MLNSKIVQVFSYAVMVGLMAWCTVAVAEGNAQPLAQKSHFKVVEHPATDTVIDNPPKGDSRGDLLVFQNPIFNASNTKQIGKDEGFCVRTKAGESWECTWTIHLNAGSIVVQGPFYDDSASTLAIIGGTGAWDEAQGTMKLKSRPNGTFYFIYDIE